jgi:hypothetical protein
LLLLTILTLSSFNSYICRTFRGSIIPSWFEMESLLLILMVVSVLTNPAVAVPAMVTPLRRDLPYYTGSDTDAPYFIGYTYNGDCGSFDNS